jgi:hypothetical protein
LKKYYFTFGSNEQFPFQNTYLIVMADSLEEAIQMFRDQHPDVHENTVNCSFWYTEEEWEKNCNLHYPGPPEQIIFHNTIAQGTWHVAREVRP